MKGIQEAEDQETRVCKRCSQLKEVSFFWKTRKGKRRTLDICWSCRNERKPRRKGNTYYDRNVNLKAIGFANYYHYLSSDLWREIRKKVFYLKGRQCKLCGGVASLIHHTRYSISDLTGKCFEHLHPVCRNCHEQIEFSAGTKLSVNESRILFERKRSSNCVIRRIFGI